MSEDWDFYSLLVDGEPASIFFDLGLAADAPILGQPHMSYVRVFMREPRPDGLSSQEEFDRLIAIERSLEASLDSSQDMTYVGRNTSSCNRDFYFYSAKPDTLEVLIRNVMADHSDYSFEVGRRHDPSWDVYLRFLHPRPEDLQRIMNRRVLENLASHDDDHSIARVIDHRAYVPSLDAAEALKVILLKDGFNVSEVEASESSAIVEFNRSDRPSDIDEIVIPLVRRIEELGGSYDGWGCHVSSE